MHIAQVAPLWEQVPPPAYGGTELIVGLLTDELVRRGHEVTLFASGDSGTLATLEPGCEMALRPQGILPPEYAVYEQIQLGRVFSQGREFDVIHSHMDYASLPYAHFSKTPVVHTLHGNFTDLTSQIFHQHRRQNFVSISNAQQRPDLKLNYMATVYNAISTDKFQFYSQPDDPPYLAFLGRMSVEKGPHLAIEIAKQSGWRLKMAGKVDFENRDFFEKEVAPHIDGKQIEFIGEANHDTKNELLGKATATLFSITWPEPFGLVMAESMACGTPVIAMNLGSAPEVIADGKTGYLCETINDCVNAIHRIGALTRHNCRDHVAANFSVQRMADGYEAVYHELLKERAALNGHAHGLHLVAS